MKAEILVILLFVAVASASLDGASDNDGVCPVEYLKKHPELHAKKKELLKKYGYPDFSKLKSCSSDGECDKDLKCCQTPCGMKCMKTVSESNPMETLEQLAKEIGTGPDDKPYEVTEEDRKYGMCPDNYLKAHPEVKELMGEKRKLKHSNTGQHGGQCFQGHSQQEKHRHLRRNFTTMADCSVDGDCSNNMRCCNTICGKKCMKPVVKATDLKESYFGKDEKKENRKKRGVMNEDEEAMNHYNEMEHGMGHGKGHRKGAGCRKGQGNRGEHGKRRGKGGEHGMCQGKGGEHGMCQGKGGEHGMCQGKGGEHGMCQGIGGEHGMCQGKGGEHRKGRRKGAKHGNECGKGHRKIQEYEDQF